MRVLDRRRVSPVALNLIINQIKNNIDNGESKNGK